MWIPLQAVQSGESYNLPQAGQITPHSSWNQGKLLGPHCLHSWCGGRSGFCQSSWFVATGLWVSGHCWGWGWGWSFSWVNVIWVVVFVGQGSFVVVFCVWGSVGLIVGVVVGVCLYLCVSVCIWTYMGACERLVWSVPLVSCWLEKDISHKYKQNFDAVLHLTSKSVLSLLSKLPDDQGTMAFLCMMQCVMDSYLVRKLGPMVRLEKAWFAVFLVCYWDWWLLQHPCYTLTHNFITTNAHVCIELNSRVHHTSSDPTWCNGETFYCGCRGRSHARRCLGLLTSMSSAFSTSINFDMLGLLCRLTDCTWNVVLNPRQHRDQISKSRSPQEEGWT